MEGMKRETFKNTRQCHITIFPEENKNEFTQEIIDKYYNAEIDTEIVTYYIIQGEYTKDKRQHFQIFAQFSKPLTYKAIKSAFDCKTIHIEPIKYGIIEDCRNYCTDNYRDKEGKPKDVWKEHKEFGNIKTQGQRSDLANQIERIKNGESINDMLVEDNTKFAQLYTQYYRPLREIETIVRQRKIDKEIMSQYDGVIWRPFQQSIINSLDKPRENHREIQWIHENTGNIGKSFLTMYLSIKYKAYVITGGRKEDILYAYNNEPIVVFDLARDFKEKEYIYEVIELLSNGQYLNTKYQSVSKRFLKPRIIIFSNFPPDTSKLSADRWNIIDLNEKVEDTDNLFREIDEDTVEFMLKQPKGKRKVWFKTVINP